MYSIQWVLYIRTTSTKSTVYREQVRSDCIIRIHNNYLLFLVKRRESELPLSWCCVALVCLMHLICTYAYINTHMYTHYDSCLCACITVSVCLSCMARYTTPWLRYLTLQLTSDHANNDPKSTHVFPPNTQGQPPMLHVLPTLLGYPSVTNEAYHWSTGLSCVKWPSQTRQWPHKQ